MSEEESSLSSLASDSTSGESSEEELNFDKCTRLKLPPNIRADLENRLLLRDEESVPCESKLAEEVMSNYIIAKRILSNVCWQEKLLCKKVCTTWQSAVTALAKENLNPVDFVYTLLRRPRCGKYGAFVKSEEFYNEPMVVLSFINAPALAATLKCKDIFPCLCKPPCENARHSVLDAIWQQVCAPKNCMLTVVADLLTYLPVPNAITEQHSPDNPTIPFPFLSGVSLPLIPGVKFHMLNINQVKENTNSMDLVKDFYEKVDKISEDQTIKGVLVFVTEKYLLHSVQDLFMLNHLKNIQPDIPYALGGCMIEETMYEDKEIDVLISRINTQKQFISQTLISIALFTVPKNADDSDHREKCTFDMFSLVILSSEWVKEKIKNAIDEFARSVPQFEHSLALKLSCVGRNKKHMLEQELFRQAFPHTPVYGCYGNGELGVNHPPRNPPEPKCKRHKADPRLSLPKGPMYSYSTVFVYMGWGKITPPDPDTPKK